MIKSDVIRIKKIDKFDNLYIENELKKLYKSVVRWAIVDIQGNDLVISISYEM